MLDGADEDGLLSGSLLAVNPTVALELQAWNGETSQWGTLSSVNLSWADAAALFGSLDDQTHSLSAFLIGGDTIATGEGPYTASATVEFVRDNQIDDEGTDDAWRCSW